MNDSGRLVVVGGGDQLIHALLRRASLAHFSSVFGSVVSTAAPASYQPSVNVICLILVVSSSVVHKCKSGEVK